MKTSSSTRAPRKLASAWSTAITATLLLAWGAAQAQPATDASAPAAAEAAAYTLGELIAMARQSSPMLAVGRADETLAQAGTITARAWPNPELAIEPGRLRPRNADALSGSSTVLSIGQPIENPWLRDARLQSAQGGIELARARTGALQANLASGIRTRFFEIMRVDEELAAYREDLQLTEQIRDRILLRVRTGEAPRFDLVRAESEVEVTRKNLLTARLRRLQALAEMRTLVGPALARDFDIRYAPDTAQGYALADYLALRETIVERNPEVGVAKRQFELAQRQVEVERNSVLPQVTLRAMQERDPETSITRIGAQVTLPLINRREGPIAEARAQAERARLALEQRRFETGAGFDAAWQGYSAAQARVQTIQEGILGRARNALDIAEAAYRLGERGILEYLDAQRQFRLARNELIAARFELRSARSEMERLLGLQ